MEFVSIKDYPCYLINLDGSVWSTKFKRFLKPDNDRGYKRITLSKNGVSKKFRTHRLVLINFVGKIKGKPYVNHLNFDRSDNSIENIRWCTQSENIIHAILYGGRQKSFIAKKIIATDEKGNVFYFNSQSELSRKVNCTLSAVTNALKRNQNNFFGLKIKRCHNE